jgi:ribosome-associated toxin RatA of RatAB toxin-antitoxin module
MPVITGSSSTDVDAPIERCWALVEDVPIAPEWQGGLERMDVLERDGDGRALICDAISDAKLRKVRTRVQFTYEGPTRLSWKMIEGDLESMEGSWELEDLGNDRTRVTYAVAVDPGPVGALVRGPIERVARAMLVNGRAKELAKRVR